MARLAVEGEPRFEVSDVEIRRGGVSYTADTLDQLHGAHPNDELFLILGWDAARLFSTWHEPDRVRSLASVVIVGRPGTETPSSSELAASGLEPERVIKCFVVTPNVSATELRRALAAGQPVAANLAPAVERYIAEQRLYRDNR